MAADLPDDRSDEEGDWIARRFFSEADLRLSPEEYAARHADRWACFSFHRYRYCDPALGTWVRRLGAILSSEEELERCHSRFPSPEGLTTVRSRGAEGS